MEIEDRLSGRGTDVSLIAGASVTIVGGVMVPTPSLHLIIISLPEITGRKGLEQLVLPVNNFISEKCI